MLIRTEKSLTRRRVLKIAAAACLCGDPVARGVAGSGDVPPHKAFETRGVVIEPENLTLKDWPERVKRAGLTTIGLHHYDSPKALVRLVQSDQGRSFLETCQKLGLDVEYELHAMRELLPRTLFAKDRSLFRMDPDGKRTADYNFCVHARTALGIVTENALVFAQSIRPTTGRYFYWSDGCRPWCRCNQCRHLSDSDQALLVENALADALRREQPNAQVAHLACYSTMPAPEQIKPAPGVFLEYAPGRRRYDIPYGRQTKPDQPDSLWYLEKNLNVFPVETAQVLDYWLDVSHFSNDKTAPLPWNRELFLADLDAYRSLGIGHIKSFANWIDADYVKRHGEPAFIKEYAAGLSEHAGR